MVHLLPGLQRLDGVDVGAGERAAAAMQFTTDEAYTLECVHRALIPPLLHGVARCRTVSLGFAHRRVNGVGGYFFWATASSCHICSFVVVVSMVPVAALYTEKSPCCLLRAAMRTTHLLVLILPGSLAPHLSFAV